MGLAALKWLGWRGGVAVIVTLALAVALWSRGSWKEEAGKWKKTAGVWETAFDTQKSAYQSAQSAAKVKLDAQRKVLKNDYDIVAERADNAKRKVNALIAASEQFARNNRVRRQAGAAGSVSGGAAATGQGDGATGNSKPGDDAVVVPRADFDTLVVNTGRLIQAHDWFKELEAKGLAEAAPVDTN